VCTGSLNTIETTIRTKQYGGEIILPNLTSEAGAKTYGPPVYAEVQFYTHLYICNAFMNSTIFGHMYNVRSPQTMENIKPLGFTATTFRLFAHKGQSFIKTFPDQVIDLIRSQASYEYVLI
jgi:hypothetical protein